MTLNVVEDMSREELMTALADEKAKSEKQLVIKKT